MLVRFDNVTFSYTGEPVLRGASFQIDEGERVGFLGGNGEGKTTAIKLLVGELDPERGEVVRRSKLKIGYLEQSGGFESESTVYGAMEEVFEEDKELIARLEEAQAAMAKADENAFRILSARCEALEKRIAARDSYSYPVRISTILNGMGFEDVYGQEVRSMSGGEKTKLKLCRLLLETPELLVLDEPTNHLDIKTLFWLEEYLSSFKGALLVVSHDRYFLDRLTSRTLELQGGELVSYKGNYSKYRVLKKERYESLLRAYEKQQEEIAKLQEYVDKNIVRATTAKSALSRVNKLERMELLEKPLAPPAPPRFRFLYGEKPHEKVLEAANFDLSVGGKTLLKGAEFTLLRGEKCALVGDNGTGKTTLLKYLLSSPRAVWGKYTRVGYYDQENAELDEGERVLDAFWGKNVALSQTEARAILAQAGLTAEDVQKKVRELSGGLKAKLSLALLEARRANVLLLDEPTNHLDLEARESLEEALRAFDGTLLFVSHDRRFIERIATSIACIEGKALTRFFGSYEEFLQTKKEPAAKPAPEPKPKTEGYRSKEERAKEAQRRERTKKIEARLEEIEGLLKELDLALAENAADYKKVREISEKQAALQEESDALYEEYEALIS